MRILVTGDRGYIGAVLVPLLIKNGCDVVGFDTEFFKTNIVNLKYPYKKITKDIREITENDLKDIDIIIHLSALSNDPLGEVDPHLTQEINFRSTLQLAKIAKKIGVKRFLFSSSCSIYGIAKNGVVNEDSKVNPLTEYAKSKIDSERELLKLAERNFCVGILRNATVYGFSPKFRNDLVVNNIVSTALAYGEIRVLSDGTPWRPLIDIRDLSKIFVEFLSVAPDKINSKVINVGFNENNFQIKDIVDIVKKYVTKCKVVYTGEHGKDTRSYKVSFNKFRTLFPHIKQEWTLAKSVKDMVENLRKNNFGKKDFESGSFTRLAVLENLLSSKAINQDLYWK